MVAWRPSLALGLSGSWRIALLTAGAVRLWWRFSAFGLLAPPEGDASQPSVSFAFQAFPLVCSLAGLSPLVSWVCHSSASLCTFTLFCGFVHASAGSRFSSPLQLSVVLHPPLTVRFHTPSFSFCFT